MDSLEKKTREYLEEMGETGKGISEEDEIDMSQSTTLVNKWGTSHFSPHTDSLCSHHVLAIIKAKFPYLWNMKSLIMERPNIIRTGIGNSEDPVDINVILTQGDNSDDDDLAEATSPQFSASPNAPDPPPTSKTSAKRRLSLLDETISSDSDDEDPELQKIIAAAAAAKKTTPTNAPLTPTPQKKTPARSGTSAPAPKGSSGKGKKKLKFSEQFNEVALAEEETRQRQLEIQLAKTDLEKMKLQAKIDTQRAKLELMQIKLKQKHALELERLRLKAQQSSVPSNGASSSFLPVPSVGNLSVRTPDATGAVGMDDGFQWGGNVLGEHSFDMQADAENNWAWDK